MPTNGLLKDHLYSSTAAPDRRASADRGPPPWLPTAPRTEDPFDGTHVVGIVDMSSTVFVFAKNSSNFGSPLPLPIHAADVDKSIERILALAVRPSGALWLRSPI